MKTTVYTIAAAITIACTALAQAASPSGTDAQISSVQISMPKHAHMLPQNFKDYQRDFLLEDGRILVFSQSQHHQYAQLEGEDKVEIYPVRHDVFATDNGIQLEFRNDRDDITVYNYDRMPMKVALQARGVVMGSAPVR